MAASPRFKVYDTDGKYQAACHELEAAACLVGALYGEGSTIRADHAEWTTLWLEGAESDRAGESFDGCAMTCLRRLESLPLLIAKRMRKDRSIAGVRHPLRSLELS